MFLPIHILLCALCWLMCERILSFVPAKYGLICESMDATFSEFQEEPQKSFRFDSWEISIEMALQANI